jgi:hypothetical protein
MTNDRISRILIHYFADLFFLYKWTWTGILKLLMKARFSRQMEIL